MTRPSEWSTADMLDRAAMIFDGQAALATGSARAAHKETSVALRERSARIRGLEGMPGEAIGNMGVSEFWRRLNGALAAPPAGPSVTAEPPAWEHKTGPWDRYEPCHDGHMCPLMHRPVAPPVGVGAETAPVGNETFKDCSWSSTPGDYAGAPSIPDPQPKGQP